MTDPLLLGAVAACVFVVAALAQAVTGFGSALVAVPLLVLVADPVTAVVAATLVSLVLTAGAGWRERAHVEVPVARTLTLTGLVGMPVGLLLLALADAALLSAWIAGVLLVAVLLVARGVRVGPRTVPVAGLASGVLLTSTGMNGPPLVMALLDREPQAYRATLQAVFAAQDLAAVAAFVVLGHLGSQAVVLAAGGVVGLPLGWWLGDLVFARVPAARLRPLVLGGLLVTAASMLVGAAT